MLRFSYFFIFYSSRDLAESSPYYEALKSQEVEVLFTYEENDEVVFQISLLASLSHLLPGSLYLKYLWKKLDEK